MEVDRRGLSRPGEKVVGLSDVSRPFDPPLTGGIAVKVINHCGNEVLKVYEAVS